MGCRGDTRTRVAPPAHELRAKADGAELKKSGTKAVYILQFLLLFLIRLTPPSPASLSLSPSPSPPLSLSGRYVSIGAFSFEGGGEDREGRPVFVQEHSVRHSVRLAKLLLNIYIRLNIN